MTRHTALRRSGGQPVPPLMLRRAIGGSLKTRRRALAKPAGGPSMFNVVSLLIDSGQCQPAIHSRGTVPPHIVVPKRVYVILPLETCGTYAAVSPLAKKTWGA